MSAFLYLASDHPLPERPNPHFRTLSVREALELGMEVPDFLLEPGVDQDALDTILWSDLELRIDTAAPLPADPGPDDDFAVWPLEEKLLDELIGISRLIKNIESIAASICELAK